MTIRAYEPSASAAWASPAKWLKDYDAAVLDPNELDEETIALVMEAAQIGIQHGLSMAESRIKGAFEVEPLSWDTVLKHLERDGD